MCLTEELLTQWTGLKGRNLSLSLLHIKKQSNTTLQSDNLEFYIKI
jgi:hypothetical protein